MSDDNVEQLKPGKSLAESALNKVFDQQRKDKKTEIEKQAKVTAEAYNVFRNAMTKLKELEAEDKALETDKMTLGELGLK